LVVYRLRGWLVVAAVVTVCVGAVWFADWYRSRTIGTREALIARLPSKDTIIVAIDFGALRRARLMDMLAGSKTPEEPEYREFVARTEFDYKEDLDLALAAFAPNGKFFLLKGRFDWNSLRSYVKSSKGDCYNTLCKMVGSTPERKISFFPLRPEIMALAVSSDSDAAFHLYDVPAAGRAIQIPDEPFWISLPGSALKQAGGLPTGTQIFAKSLEEADDVLLAIGPEGKDFQAKLRVNCRSEKDAGMLAAELERSTNLLRSMIARENRTPNPRDLSGVLTAGRFSHAGRQVTGHWPISQGLVQDTLTGGS
jgi:hypothetical protein